MRRRGLVILGVAAALVVLIALVALVSFPSIVRYAVVWGVQSVTAQRATVDAARFDPFTGKFSVSGFTLADREGAAFATFDRLEGRLHRRSLFRGHVWIQELALRNSAVRVVRYDSGEFNLADFIKRGEKRGEGSVLDVTVDHFSLDGGLVTLEDRMLTPPRTWKAENLTLDARNVSTKRNDGTAVASSLLNGAPVTVKVDDLRLLPAHLRAVIEMQGGDLALARVYLPPQTPVTIDRGRLQTRISVLYDAKDGMRVDGDGRIADAVVLRRHQKDPVLVAPELTFAFRDLAIGNDRTFALARFEATGGGTAQATAATASRFAITRLRAVVEAVTWPVREPARIDIVSSVPGGGEISVRGTAHLNPRRADLEVRATGVQLEPWARFLPTTARVTGVGDARFNVTASLEERNLAATAKGTAGVNRLVVSEGDRRVVSADRAEVSSLNVAWPLALEIGRVRLVRPTGTLERDEHGEFPLLKALTTRGGSPSRPPATSVGAISGPPLKITEIVVEGGQFGWRDATVKPAARLDVDGIGATVRDAVWPPAGPMRVTLQARTPNGGRVTGNGTVTVEPLSADLKLVTDGVDIASAAPYLALPARVAGRADVDLRVTLARSEASPNGGAAPWKATAKGRATLRSLTVADANSQIATAERIEATGLDVDWPTRLVAQRVLVQKPFVLAERNDKGEFPLRALVVARKPPAGAPPAEATRPKLAMSIGQAVIENGTVRIVDRSMSTAFTEELRKLDVRVSGLGMGALPPARYQISGALNGTSRVQLKGTLGPLDRPLALDGEGELNDFRVARVNPYLRQFTSWEAREGRLSTTMRYQVAGDDLSVRNDIRISRLDLVRVAQDDPAQRRIGLPLGMVTGLMKNSRGDIALTIPIGGKLSDPRFEFSEAIWGAVRAIAIRTIAAPVSWIGRLRVGKDSRIEEIEIDPVAFAAGTTKLTAKGRDQVERLSGYLRNSAGARMVLTPVVTIGDIDQLRAEALEAAIQQRSRERGVSDLAAAQALYIERFPGREPPKDRAELIAAMRDSEPPPEKAAQHLASKRVDAVRDTLKEAGIDPARLEPSRDVEGLEAPEGGRVEIALTDRVRPKRGLLAELLHKLMVALKSPARAIGPGSGPAPATRPSEFPSAFVPDQKPAAVLQPRHVPRLRPGEDRDPSSEEPKPARDVPGR